MRTMPFFLLATLLLGSHALAETYTWKDKTGKTIFSDRPPVESQSAQTVDEAATGRKDGTADDEVRRRIAQEEARKQKKAESEKKLVAWRCEEMVKQKKDAEAQYDNLVKTDAKKAAVLKTDIDNYADTLKRMCE